MLTPPGVEIAVTAEESKSGVESVTVLPPVPAVDRSVNDNLKTNMAVYVASLARFIDSSHSSGLKIITVAT